MPSITLRTLALLMFGALSAQLSHLAVASEFADSVFINGDIYLGQVRNPWANEVAVTDGRFIYVGDDAAAHIGPETQVFDLEGRMAMPGMVDGHTHVGLVALSSNLVEMDPASTRAELMLNIQQMVEDHAEQAVIIGGYWPNELFGEEGPHKKDLDVIESKRPVILYDELTHSVWANSKALEMAGVTSETPDIVPGFSFYQKDENGEPTGWITESAASVFINNFQEVSLQVESAMLEYLNYFKSMGVTTLLDAGNFGLDQEVYAAVSELDQQGLLPVRFHGSYTLFIPQDAPTAVQTLKALGEQYNSENVKIDTLKVFFDGVVDTRTAAMLEDYLDTPGNSGETLLDRRQVHDLIVELDAEGLNFHAHTVGDRATRTLLDGIEDAHATLGRPPAIRTTLCHLEFVADTDFARFRPLGIVSNFTPHWAHGTDLSWYEAGIGALAFDMQRGQPMLSDGAWVSFSSDNTTESEWKSPRASSSPFTGMQVGHTRQDVGIGADDPILPPASERLQLGDLLNGYTSGGAYQLGRSDIGSIAVGKRADMVVLDQNIFEINPYDIHRTKPIAVIVDGEIEVGELSSEQD